MRELKKTSKMDAWASILGVNATALLLIGPLWQADASLSKQAKQDIAGFLSRIDYAPASGSIRRIIDLLLSTLYDSFLFSKRSFLRSLRLTTIFFLFGCAIVLTFSTEVSYSGRFIGNDLTFFSIPNSVVRVTDLLFATLVPLILSGFVSSVITRYLIRNKRISIVWIFPLDLLLTTAGFFLILIACFAMNFFINHYLIFNLDQNFEQTWRLPFGPREFPRFIMGYAEVAAHHTYYLVMSLWWFVQNPTSGKEYIGWSMLINSMALFGTALTLYMNTVWSAIVVIGGGFIQFARKTDVIFWLQYGLDIQDKPMRSIAAVCTILLIAANLMAIPMRLLLVN